MYIYLFILINVDDDESLARVGPASGLWSSGRGPL